MSVERLNELVRENQARVREYQDAVATLEEAKQRERATEKAWREAQWALRVYLDDEYTSEVAGSPMASMEIRAAG